MDIWKSGTAPPRLASARWELALARALRRETAGRVEFATAYSPARPWLLPELFCFAGYERLGTEDYIIYAFDRRGDPVF